MLCRSRTLMGIDGLHCCTTAGYWATVKLSERSTILALSSSRRIETASVRPHRLKMIEEGWKLVILGFRRVKPSRWSLSRFVGGLVSRNRVCDQPSAVIPVRYWASGPESVFRTTRRPTKQYCESVTMNRVRYRFTKSQPWHAGYATHSSLRGSSLWSHRP